MSIHHLYRFLLPLLIASICTTLSIQIKAGGSSQAEGPTEEFATAEAVRKKPKDAVITSTSCKTIEIAFSLRYRCTAHWTTNKNQSPMNEIQ